EVIHLDSIAPAAHLLPVYGSSHVPEDFNHHHALDAYDTFFVNHFINHHNSQVHWRAVGCISDVLGSI
ncbi:hypothetical protein EI94DRAFT_1622907, partial [Lactarius quietus]